MDTVELPSRNSNCAEKVNKKCSMLSLLVSLFPFVMFMIPLQITTYDRIWNITGYDTFFQWSEIYDWWGDGSSAILCVNILIASIAFVMIACNVFWLTKGVHHRNVAVLFDVLVVVFGQLYFIEGIILVLLCSSWYGPTTFSYIASVLSIIFVGVKHILISVWKKGESSGPQFVATNNATDVANQIREYKKLLDDGAITQEEYDAIKKKMLGL